MVELQLSAQVLVTAVAAGFVLSCVHDESLIVHLVHSLGAQRVVHIVEGIGVETGRGGLAAAVVGGKAEVGSERESSALVDVPLQVHVGGPVVVARIALVDAIGEGVTSRIDEVLCASTVPVVGIAVRPCHTSVHLQVFVVLVAHVQSCRLRVALPVVIASSSSAAPREVAVVHVVSISHERISSGTERLHCRQSHSVASLRANAHIGVHLQSVAHAALGDKLEHEIVIAIVDARHAGQVALLVVGFHLVHHIRGQVFHHGIVVARHEVAAVHLEFLHTLAVDSHRAAVVDLRSWQHLDQRLNDRPLGHPEGIGIVNHRIVFDNHLRNIGCHHGLADLHRLSLQLQVAQHLCTPSGFHKAFRQPLIPQKRRSQHIASCRHTAKREASLPVGKRACHEGSVSTTVPVRLRLV